MKRNKKEVLEKLKANRAVYTKVAVNRINEYVSDIADRILGALEDNPDRDFDEVLKDAVAEVSSRCCEIEELLFFHFNEAAYDWEESGLDCGNNPYDVCNREMLVNVFLEGRILDALRSQD